MGIALLALSDLFTPIQSLASRWMTPQRGAKRHNGGVDLEADLRYVQVLPTTGSRTPEHRSAARPQRPLRVVRVTEADHPKAQGRVLLSGRLEDVCAELDRLAALEAAQGHAAPSRHLH